MVSLVACAALVGTFGYLGVAAQQPATYTVSGGVYDPAGSPVVDAQVVLTNEANQSTPVLTGSAGTFSFTGDPVGGVLLNATKPGYAFTAVLILLSTVYVSTGAATGIVITLNSASSSNGTIILTTPFADRADPRGVLERFVTDLWSVAGLLLLVVIVDAVAILRTLRSTRPLMGVAAGFGSLLAPLPIALFNVEVAVPIPSLVTVAVAALGGFAVGIGLMEMVQSGAPTAPG
jgi:hypothetical protein